MKLAEIMQLALRQLDEDPADVSDYDDLFRRYANEGYQVVMRHHYKRRKMIQIETDEHGAADVSELGIVRVIELHGKRPGGVWFGLSLDGTQIFTRERNAVLDAMVETEIEPLCKDADEPQFPAWAHPCLADYICYRHLSAGNAAKQQKAQFWYRSFYETMSHLRPVGQGSVTRPRNLYTVTDIRYGGR